MAVLKVDEEFEQNIALVPQILTLLLQSTKSFRYEPMPPLSAITVRKRDDTYWLAYRKVGQTVRNFYLGKAEDITYEKLKDAATVLSMEEEEYKETILERKQVRQNKKCITKDASEGHVRVLEDQLAAIQTERDELEEKNQQLQEQLEALQRDYTALQLRISSTIPTSTQSTVGAKTKNPKPTCPHCGSTGHHTNKGIRGNKRRWMCIDCKKTFSVDIGAE